MTMTKRDAIVASMSVAEDIDAGRLDPATLKRQVVAELSDLVGTVVGPDDPIWELQVQVARGVLAAGGIPADEQAEWLAVSRRRDGVTEIPAQAIPIAAELLNPVLDPLDDEIEVDVEQDVVLDQDQPAISEADVEECISCQSTSSMVVMPDGRGIPSRMIAARGRGVPGDNGLRPL